MAKAKNTEVKPGDPVRVRWSLYVMDAVVTSVSGDNVHVTFSVEGSDEPVNGLYRMSELLAA
ncbi:hypothetical protein ACWZHB_00200 [Nocardia sp. FBN12]|uniref:hypothetical protein n=1 Tax=Nocardia sp. FBN12 TaxID=3419766 RepID=UPI003D061F4E